MDTTDVEQVRARLLDAAERCYRAGGIDGLGMVDIAEEAGVARSTVYRYFANRDELLLALVRREIDATATVVEAALEGIDDPAERIVEGIVHALRELPRRDLLRDLFVSDRFALARQRVWSAGAMVELGQHFMDPVLQPALSRERLRKGVRWEIQVEWVYRTLISLLTLPASWTRSEDELRHVLSELLIPALFESE